MKSLLSILFITSINVFCISQEVIEVTKVCDMDCRSDYVKNRLIEKKKSGDTTLLRIAITENCDILPVFHFRNSNDTLYFSIENRSDIFAACDCCFDFQVKLIGLADTNFLLVHEDVDNEKSKDYDFEKINRSEVLVYQKNKYIFPTYEEMNSTSTFNETENGIRIGLWQEYYEETGIIKSKSFYGIDESGNSKRLWTVFFDHQGNLKELCASRRKDGMTFSICIDKNEYESIVNNEP